MSALVMEGAIRATQARGRVRRESLLAAARELLAVHDSSQITLADIAAHAAVPKSSAYHFYKDALGLYVELVALLDAELQELIKHPLPRLDNWEMAMAVIIDRAAAFFDNNPAAQQLMLSSQTPPLIKRSSRQADMDTSRLIEALIDTQFILPVIPDRSRIFFHAVEAADLMFGLSLLECGRLEDNMVEEAKRMSCAYLALYLPKYMPHRT
ncbi:MAG: TetR family transcriptional regulator [Pseudomonadota bacterium]